MFSIKSFEYNPFQENTYVIVHNATNECIIIDPGAYTASEQIAFEKYISLNSLKPTLLLLTHTHLDHIFGLDVVVKKYALIPHLHKEDNVILINASIAAQKYGMSICDYSGNVIFIDEKTKLVWNDLIINILFTPGHSPGSLCFVINNNALIAGDVIFYESYGRTDLYMGNMSQLRASIINKLFTLPEEIIVYPGHGGTTTIKHEKKHNPIRE